MLCTLLLFVWLLWLGFHKFRRFFSFFFSFSISKSFPHCLKFKCLFRHTWERSFQLSTVLSNQDRTNKCNEKSLSTQKVAMFLVFRFCSRQRMDFLGGKHLVFMPSNLQSISHVWSLYFIARLPMFLHLQIISSVGFWIGDFGEW